MPPLTDPLKGEPVYKFCNRTNLVQSDEGDLFFMALFSGGEPSVYVFTPDHMKQLLRQLTKKIENYEQKYGPIKGILPNERPIPSPIDLSKGKDDEIGM